MSFCSLTKGITPTICRLCVCVVINKRSFEPKLSNYDSLSWHSPALVTSSLVQGRRSPFSSQITVTTAQSSNHFISPVVLLSVNHFTPPPIHPSVHSQPFYFLSFLPAFLSQPIVCMVSQSVSQSVSLAVSPSVRPSVSQSVSQSFNQPVRQSVSQPVSQSGCQSVSPSVRPSVSQSFNQPVRQPVSQSVSQPVS